MRNLFEDVGGGTVAGNLEITLARIVVQHGTSDLLIGAQAFANHVLSVVFAYDERRAVVVAAAGYLGAFRKDVVHLAALRAHAAAHHPAYQDFGGHIEMNDNRRGQVSGSDEPVQIL